MEDENQKEENQPSTSKKETSQRTASGNDLYEERGGHEERATNSDTSVSATYSVRSRIDMADARPEVPKPPIGKREPKVPERKKRGRRGGGRVEKRRRSLTRRQVRRAPLKRRARPLKEKDRDLSVSTIFTRLSSRSGSRTPGCIHCGHRCCRRRYENIKKRSIKDRRNKEKKMLKKKIMKAKSPKKLQRKLLPKKKIIRKKEIEKQKSMLKEYARQLSGTKRVQIGSRSHMLSPLFVNTNSTPESGAVTLPKQSYCEITPEMICEALRILTLWKQDVQSLLIMEYIKRNYPVNPVESELYREVKEKLRVASIAGIVIETSQDLWALSCELQSRKLTTNHVTLFWQAYADTMSPITKKPDDEIQKDPIEKQTNTARKLAIGPEGDELV